MPGGGGGAPGPSIIGGAGGGGMAPNIGGGGGATGGGGRGGPGMAGASDRTGDLRPSADYVTQHMNSNCLQYVTPILHNISNIVLFLLSLNMFEKCTFPRTKQRKTRSPFNKSGTTGIFGSLLTRS